jgi:hypothetical protein
MIELKFAFSEYINCILTLDAATTTKEDIISTILGGKI